MDSKQAQGSSTSRCGCMLSHLAAAERTELIDGLWSAVTANCCFCTLCVLQPDASPKDGMFCRVQLLLQGVILGVEGKGLDSRSGSVRLCDVRPVLPKFQGYI